jgi:hypothetical protein
LKRGHPGRDLLALRDINFHYLHHMANLDNETAASHDFSAISPSAYSLLMMKGHTNIPFAREAAALLENTNKGQDMFTADFGMGSANYWITLMHFESRYWSIDQLLDDQPFTNILELSSGFSFRGLALSRHRPVYYIDTDLDGVIDGKQRFVDAFTARDPTAHDRATRATEADSNAENPPGHYELQPLNVLDPAAFRKIIARFPPGPIAIVNEGLLVYLDNAEKEGLSQNIREALLTRGGCWITADIYLQRQAGDPLPVQSASSRQWHEKHKIEEKKFNNFEEARSFFYRMGFTVDKEARPNYDRLSSLARLREAGGAGAIAYLRQSGRARLHATWRLLAS